MGAPRLVSSNRNPVAVALAGTGWAVLFTPPQIVAAGVHEAPAWTRTVGASEFYGHITGAFAALGVTDPYVVFGMLIAPAFVLVGLALLYCARHTNGWVAAVAWLTLLGAPIALASYGGEGLGPPWDFVGGTELALALVTGACALVAAIVVQRRGDAPMWWAVALALTLPVMILSTEYFEYWPHGTVVGQAVLAVILAAGAPASA